MEIKVGKIVDNARPDWNVRKTLFSLKDAWHVSQNQVKYSIGMFFGEAIDYNIQWINCSFFSIALGNIVNYVFPFQLKDQLQCKEKTAPKWKIRNVQNANRLVHLVAGTRLHCFVHYYLSNLFFSHYSKINLITNFLIYHFLLELIYLINLLKKEITKSTQYLAENKWLI